MNDILHKIMYVWIGLTQSKKFPETSSKFLIVHISSRIYVEWIVFWSRKAFSFWQLYAIVLLIKNFPLSFARCLRTFQYFFPMQTMNGMTQTMEPNSATNTDTADIKHQVVDDAFLKTDVLASPKRASLIPTSKIHLSPPDSLRRMLTSGSPLKSSRSPYPVDFEMFKKRVENKLARSDSPSAFELYGYGYGYGADEDASPKQREQTDGTKRRRFERRNSKTPAMMMMSMKSPLLCHLDFLEDKKEFETSSTETSTTASSPEQRSSFTSTIALSPRLESRAIPNFDVWDGGLEIAEDLVLQLQKRKRPSKP